MGAIHIEETWNRMYTACRAPIVGVRLTRGQADMVANVGGTREGEDDATWAPKLQAL
jgi:hypothetical protein